MEGLDLIERTFRARLSHIEESVKLVMSAQRFHALQALAYPPNREDLDPYALNVIEEFHQLNLEGITVLYRGAFIASYSAFEAFFSECVACIVSSFPSQFGTFSAMPVGIRNEIDRTISKALATLSGGRATRGLQRELLVSSFGSCHEHDGAFQVYADAHKKYLEMPNAESIKAILSRLGVDLNWDKIGDDKDLRKHFNAKNTRESSKLLTSYIDKIISMRNSLVHIEAADPVINEEDVSEILKFYRYFTPPFLKIISSKKYLKKMN